MGRLEDIVERNQHPSRHRKMRLPVGLMLSAFVLLILVLMIFTDAGISPTVKDDKATAPAESHQGEKHVDGIYLYRARATRDAGSRD